MSPTDTEKSEQLASNWIAAQPTLTAFVGTLLPRPDDVAEVLQRVAVALVRKVDGYDPRLSFTAWAIGIAKFEVKAFRRERATGRVRLVDDELLDQIAARYQGLSERSGPVQDALAECLRRLEDRSRRLLEMRYADDAKPAEIARTLGVSSGAVRTALSKTRTALRNCVTRRLQARGGAL